MSFTRKEIQQYNQLIAEFMGYEKVTVGYYGGDDETEWQRNNQDFMRETGMDDIGDYIVNVKEKRWFDWHAVKYHTSWNWLMPVITKIEDIDEGMYPPSKNNFHFFICKRYTRVIYKWDDYFKEIGPNNYEDHFDSFKEYKHSLFDNDKLKSTYHAVVDFIKWYKKQSTK